MKTVEIDEKTQKLLRDLYRTKMEAEQKMRLVCQVLLHQNGYELNEKWSLSSDMTRLVCEDD